MFLKQYKLCRLYTNDINNGAYCRLWSHANSGLSLAVGSNPAILHSLKMVRLYRNMSQLRVYHSYVTNNVYLVGTIN
jgi:hypothetical protein